MSQLFRLAIAANSPGPGAFVDGIYEPDCEPAGKVLAEYLVGLGFDELRVLSLIAERLEMGRAEHGVMDIHGDTRDWAVELGHEAADALVYAAAVRIQAGEPLITTRKLTPDEVAELSASWKAKYGGTNPPAARFGRSSLRVINPDGSEDFEIPGGDD